MKITSVALALFAVLLSSCQEKSTAANPAPPVPPVVDKGGDADTDDAFIGQAVDAAAALAKERKLISRIISVDGQPRPATKDYRPDRVNFEIEQGKVVKVSRG